jgi:hypothetical protein
LRLTVSKGVGTWVGVVAGSRLELSVNPKEPEKNHFVAEARIIPDKGTQELVSDHELDPGPHFTDALDGVSYVTRVGATFIGAAVETCVVKARLLDPAGAPQPNTDGDTVYSFDLSGQAKDEMQRCALVLLPKVP